MAFDLEDYVDVAERIALFKEKHPEGSLQPANLLEPYKILSSDDGRFVVYVAAAYRTPEDQRPGVGVAWEPFPGKTPYTKDSELQNAETSAWGRAIVAALAADTKRGVASKNEVAARRADGDQPARTDEKATVKQRQMIERLVNTTGYVPDVWPLSDDLTKAGASKLIDQLQANPKEAKAERRDTMREPQPVYAEGEEPF